MSLNRRTFVRNSAIAAAATGLPMSVPRKVRGANDEIRVGVIGVNSRGKSHMSYANSVDGVRVVAVCDVDSEVLESKANAWEKQYGSPLDRIHDYQDMIARDDIDIISIATPNHWHSKMAIDGAAGGKDVYVEKPVSHNVWEGRQVVNASKKYGKIIQTGTQCRSNKGMIDMVNYVHSGELGKIQWIAGTCYKSRESIGKRATPLDIPKNIDYERWCGPSQKVDLYRDKVHYDWHWDFNTGNGDMGNQGIHQMDLARWFLGADELSPEIISVGGRFGYEDAGNTPNTQVVCHNYKKAPVYFETRGMPSAKEFRADSKSWHAKMDNLRMVRIGVIIQCEGGYMSVGSYSSGRAYDNNDQKIKSFSGGGDHYQNFIDSVRSRDRSTLNADINEGHLSSALCHTGAISHRLGSQMNQVEAMEAIKGTHDSGESFARLMDHLRANEINIDKRSLTVGPWLKMDPKTERFTNSNAANKMLKDQQRGKYSVPDIAIA